MDEDGGLFRLGEREIAIYVACMISPAPEESCFTRTWNLPHGEVFHENDFSLFFLEINYHFRSGSKI